MKKLFYFPVFDMGQATFCGILFGWRKALAVFKVLLSFKLLGYQASRLEWAGLVIQRGDPKHTPHQFGKCVGLIGVLRSFSECFRLSNLYELYNQKWQHSKILIIHEGQVLFLVTVPCPCVLCQSSLIFKMYVFWSL